MDDEPDPASKFNFRPINQNDRQFLSKLLKNPHIAKNFLKGSEYMDFEIDEILNKMLNCWGQNQLGFYVVYQGPEPLGIAGFNYLPEYQDVEIVYCLDESFWGQGLASPLVNELIKIGFEDLKLSKILGIVKVHNTPSYKVLQKNQLQMVKQFSEKSEDYFLMEICNPQGNKQLVAALDVGL